MVKRIIVKHIMVEDDTKDWRELCRAASVEEDPSKLLGIVSEVITILKSEECRKRRPPASRQTSTANP